MCNASDSLLVRTMMRLPPGLRHLDFFVAVEDGRMMRCMPVCRLPAFPTTLRTLTSTYLDTLGPDTLSAVLARAAEYTELRTVVFRLMLYSECHPDQLYALIRALPAVTRWELELEGQLLSTTIVKNIVASMPATVESLHITIFDRGVDGDTIQSILATIVPLTSIVRLHIGADCLRTYVGLTDPNPPPHVRDYQLVVCRDPDWHEQWWRSAMATNTVRGYDDHWDPRAVAAMCDHNTTSGIQLGGLGTVVYVHRNRNWRIVVRD
jgi:hypothetical protein